MASFQAVGNSLSLKLRLKRHVRLFEIPGEQNLRRAAGILSSPAALFVLRVDKIL